MTTANIDLTVTLAELAARVPAASRVFRRHRLDYCCNGRRALVTACYERALDPAAILDEIAHEDGATSEAGDAARWTERPLPDLVAHIVSYYHERLRRELPELIAMADKVELVHVEKASVPTGLAKLLVEIEEEVTSHLAKEERVLFPMIAAGHGSRVGAPVQVMELEHDGHGRQLEHIRALTNDLVPPDDACTTWRALYLRLAAFESELMEHIHLENNVLFRRALGEQARSCG
jgi:regulator of cell morphogenesis and NO signaling